MQDFFVSHKKTAGINVMFSLSKEQMANRFSASFVNDFKTYLSIPKRLLESASAC